MILCLYRYISYLPAWFAVTVFLTVFQPFQYFSNIYDDVDLSDCPALGDVRVKANNDRIYDEEYYDEDGNYIDSNDSDDPTIYPDLPPEDENENDDNVPSTASSMHSSDDITSSSTNIEDVNGQDDSNEPFQSGPLTQTGNDSNSNQAKYILIAMTSVILSLLCN